MKRSPGLFLLAAAVIAAASASSPQKPEVFPKVEGWSLQVVEKVYTPGNLWDLIDGAADVYLSYGFVDLRIGEYRNGPDIDVRVELYRHSSPENAFGMYAQERNTDYRFLQIGTQGYAEDGILNFLCGAYYVKLTTQRSGPDGVAALKQIAAKVAQHLPQGYSWPKLLSLFPSGGKRANAEQYIAENFLGYSVLRGAFTAVYDAPAPYTCFLIDAATAGAAVTMVNSYLAAVGAPPLSPSVSSVRVTDPHSGAIRIAHKGSYVYGVVFCSDDAVADRALEALSASVGSR